jgi:hypothetical protein
MLGGVSVRSIFAIVLALFLLLPGEVFGTQIVVVVAPAFVVIAADSLVTQTGGRPPFKKCKIRHTGKLFWSAAGVTGDAFTG